MKKSKKKPLGSEVKSQMYGVKNIVVHAESPYPVVSAYEFEFLKLEECVRELLSDSTIYLIAQRPTLYFDELQELNGVLHFKIKDSVSSEFLKGEMPLYQKAMGTETPDEYYLNPHFYVKHSSTTPPFNMVAGFKILKPDQSFISWFTPHKVLYQKARKTIDVKIEGDIRKFIDFKVHYIGQAFDRKVWQRLTGHEKMQKVLTLEYPSTKDFLESQECVLIFFRIVGYDEPNMIVPLIPDEAKNYANLIEDPTDLAKMFIPTPITEISAQLTNDIEARMINYLKPKYNQKLFEKYPDIKQGLRSLGYNEIQLVMNSLSELYTDNGRIPIHFME